MECCQVVAELGCVHLGDIDRAKELILLAKYSGADYVKFQKRNPEESVPRHMWNKPHPNSIFSYGETYLDHRKALELSISQHFELKDFCLNVGIKYACSIWDYTSSREIIKLNPEYIKFGSPVNCNFDLMQYVIDNYSGNIHISLGMVDNIRRKNIINFILSQKCLSRFVVYHCTSEYPCPFEHLYLKEISFLIDSLPKDISIGFSNHGYGIASDIAAYALGATWIERHFIDDRTIKHSDAAASLEPSGLLKLCRDLKNINKAMYNKVDITEEERRQSDKLRVI